MTFKVLITYQIHDNSVMTKEMTGVEKVERCVEKWNGENTELFKVHYGAFKAATWAAGAILHVNMIPERTEK